MGIEYLGLSSINGPLVILEGVQDAFFDEIVEFTVDGKTKKIGRIIELYEDKAVIQVFEGTENMSLDNTRTKLTGHPMEVSLAPDMLGRTFNGIGKPIDGLGPLITDVRRDVNGLPLNPVRRKYPRNYIRTGISAIDGLTTLIRGQKLPIFSGNGLPHDQLAAQIVKQASLGDGSDEPFAVVFGAMGVKHDVAEFFIRNFRDSGALARAVMFFSLADAPSVERLLTPRVALTLAEHLAFDCGQPRLKRCHNRRIDTNGHIGHTLHNANGLGQQGWLVGQWDASVDINDMCTCGHLVDGILAHAVKITGGHFGSQFFAPSWVDTLANDDKWAVWPNNHSFGRG